MFNYQSVPEAKRDRLQEIASEAFENRPSSSVEIVRIGGLLDEASKIIPHGHFRPWVRLECPWSFDQVYRFINAFRRFSHLTALQIAMFEQSALYALSYRNVSKDDTQRAILYAEAGNRITWTESQKILGRWDEKTNAALKREPKQEAVQKASEAWDTLTITRDVDPENGLVIYAVLAINTQTGERRSSAHSDLKIAVQAVTGDEPIKECQVCKKRFSLGSFSIDRNAQDGRGKRCKICERKRVNDYDKKQKLKAQERTPSHA